MTKRTKGFFLLGLLVALILAGIVSYYASNSPDGLNKVAADQGFDKSAQSHASKGAPLAGYSAKGVGNERLANGVAGAAGVAITLLVGSGLVYAIRRRGGTVSVAEEEGEPLAAAHD